MSLSVVSSGCVICHRNTRQREVLGERKCKMPLVKTSRIFSLVGGAIFFGMKLTPLQ